MRVSLSKSDRSFRVTPEQPVLQAALDAGFLLPHSCGGGNCGACRARLLQGEVWYPNGRPLGLSDAEVNLGYILLCQARVRSDLLIETLEIGTPETAVVKRLPSRIDRIESLSHDVLALFLRLPAAESFHFQPGQYIDILLSGGRRRSFSIASPPHDGRLLELHIRRVPGGHFTEQLFENCPRNALLTLEGPFGGFVYRPAGDARMLLVGGGTGLAPLKSIVRHVVENDLHRDMTLYWGVRAERDLYAHAYLESLEREVPNFRYRPVLSEPAPEWPGRRGWVHEAVVREQDKLDGIDIYVSGPPALIAAAQREFAARGAEPARLLYDSFDYAPEAPVRQPTSAATKS